MCVCVCVCVCVFGRSVQIAQIFSPIPIDCAPFGCGVCIFHLAK